MDEMNKIKEFITYQDSYIKIVEELISGYNKKRYKEWKGFITLDGPVVEQPDILFIGINPGSGLYEETNYGVPNNAKKIPFRIFRTQHMTKDVNI